MNYLKVSVFFLTLLIGIGCKENTDRELAKNDEGTHTDSLSRDALLDTVQQQTLKYFWDYAEPNSGMARERYHPDGIYPEG